MAISFTEDDFAAAKPVFSEDDFSGVAFKPRSSTEDEDRKLLEEATPFARLTFPEAFPDKKASSLTPVQGAENRPEIPLPTRVPYPMGELVPEFKPAQSAPAPEEIGGPEWERMMSEREPIEQPTALSRFFEETAKTPVGLAKFQTDESGKTTIPTASFKPSNLEGEETGLRFALPEAKLWEQLPEGTIKRLGAGGYNAFANLINFFISPQGAALGGIDALPEVAKRSAAGYFAYTMAKSAPDQLEAGDAALSRGDIQGAAENWLGALLSLGLAGAGAHGAINPVVIPKAKAPPKELAPTPERTPNASTITSTEGLPQPEIWTPVGEEAWVRQQGQTAGTQVKTEVSPPPAEQVRAEVTPDIVQFGQDFAAGKKISTEAAVGVGLKAKSIADLEALMEIQAKFKEEVAQARQRVKSATTPAEQQAALQEAVIKGTSAQLPREAIEGAVNAGSNAERGNIKFGERPLDWRKNLEVAEWLKKNGEKIGIKLPDELKSETPTTQIAATPEGGKKPQLPKQAWFTPQIGGKQTIAEFQSSGLPAGKFYALDKPFESDAHDIAQARKVDVPAVKKTYDPDGLIGPKTENLHEQFIAEENKVKMPKGGYGLKELRQIRQRFSDFLTSKGYDSYVRGIDGNPKDRELIVLDSSRKVVTPSTQPPPAPAAAPVVEPPKPPSIPPPTPPSSGAPPPPTPPVPPTPPAPVPPSGSPAPVTLADVYKRFEPAPKQRMPIGKVVSNIIEAVRTGLSSKFRPIDKLAEDIAKAYGAPSRKGIAGIFEQLKGSSGKGEADIYRFDQDVSKTVRGNEKDFNAYIFLRRGIDRLNQDLADIQKAQAGAPVAKLNRRAISNYTIPELEAKLQLLESNLGPEKVKQFQQAADAYQMHMDNALKLQVDSGRMSPEVYQTIKDGNQFYAPFKVMRWIQENSRPEGTGRRVDTTAEFTKAMEGIESPDFKLGDMLGAARQNILLSRILAEKNTTMRRFADLADLDTKNLFVQKLKTGQEVPGGMEAVNVFRDGKQERYAVNPDIAQAVQLYGQNANSIVSQVLQGFSIPFKAGATMLNLPFQVSNLMADVPRAALVSKYGVRGVSDLVRYPLEFLDAMYSSMSANMLGIKNRMYQDFLDSGAAGTTVQEHLTPKGLQFQSYSLPKKVAHNTLFAVADFAKAIEQTSKVLGVKRAIRLEGVKSGAELAKQIPTAITEIRRFSGSPDFGRQGKWVEQARLNLLYMFLNARIQGATADIGRLTGRDGKATAAKTWLKVGTAVGIPTAYLYLLNNSKDNADDYAKRPAQEKANYWLIPKDSYITNEQGEKIRDYWRIPKRESSKWIANMVESGLQFAEKRDPKTLAKWGQNMMEDISPVNIQGNTFQERMESTASSLNPVLKTPLELATGRDMYRHKDVVPDIMQKASPEEQYTDRTADTFKKLAVAMPDVAPEVFRSPLRLENMVQNLTAGLFTQFMHRKPIQGRSTTEQNPLLQRFQALPYTDNEQFRNEIAGFERESTDAMLTRQRAVTKLISENPNLEPDKLLEKAPEQFQQNPVFIRHMLDLYIANRNGITGQERQLLALPSLQRAQYIASKLEGVTPEQKQVILDNFAKKRILTESVGVELGNILGAKTGQ